MFHASSKARSAARGVVLVTLTAAVVVGLYRYLEVRPANVHLCVVNASSGPIHDLTYSYRSHVMARGDLSPEEFLTRSVRASEPFEATLQYTRPDGIVRSAKVKWRFSPGHHGSYYVILADEGVWQQVDYPRSAFPWLEELPSCQFMVPYERSDFDKIREWPPRTGENANLDEIRARRRAWRAHQVSFYAMVVSEQRGESYATVRHVVRNGRAVSVSVLYGRDAEHGRTMEDLFDFAESVAAPVLRALTPSDFEARYGPYDTIQDVSAGSRSLMDAGFSMHVACFSPDPDGCQPNPHSGRMP